VFQEQHGLHDGINIPMVSLLSVGHVDRHMRSAILLLTGRNTPVETLIASARMVYGAGVARDTPPVPIL